MRLPIFQQSWGLNKDEEFGLLFSSEFEYEPQTFTFTLPVPKNIVESSKAYGDFVRSLYENDYYFPVEIAGEYLEAQGYFNSPENWRLSSSRVRRQSPMISFRIPDYQPFSFEIDIYPYFPFNWMKRERRVRFLNSYTGNFKREFFDNFYFVTIEPTNIHLLNEFFIKNQGIFVGYTIEFGRFDF